mmetsp:Transcript_13723/g.43401  ORF Transcript_13723/g.43401 Transcript_13723/m.43401 type:complete len:567 (-) Transcript_13723:90-1790(-)
MAALESQAEALPVAPPEAAPAEQPRRSASRRRGSRRRTLEGGGSSPGESVATGVRLRPLLPHERLKETGVCVGIEHPGRVTISDPQNFSVRTYECDFAFDSSDPSSRHFARQEDIYAAIGSRIVDRASEGINCCLCAYGQTGTGKTHTIHGDWSHPERRGLLPRIAEGLFSKLDGFHSAGAEVRMQVSYIEVYNDRLYDLLGAAGGARPAPSSSKRGGRLEIYTHPTVGIYVDNLSELVVRDFDSVSRLAAAGDRAKHVAATSMNAHSSRSHCVFTFKMEVRNGTDGEGNLMATVQVVDLAGRENEQTSECTGDRFRELTFINRSLFQLANCINALSSGAREHVPFRNSKLTMLLSESFQRNCRTYLLATLTPSSLGYEDNLSTCRFLESAGQVWTEPVVNRYSSAELQHQLQGEIDRMRTQLGLQNPGALPPLLRSRQALLRRLSESWDEDSLPKASREAQLRGECRRVGRSLRGAAEALERLEEVNEAAGSVLSAAEGQLQDVEGSLHRLQEELSGDDGKGAEGAAPEGGCRLPPLAPASGQPRRKADAPVVTFAIELPPILFI